jgi:hypothetical protein
MGHEYHLNDECMFNTNLLVTHVDGTLIMGRDTVDGVCIFTRQSTALQPWYYLIRIVYDESNSAKSGLKEVRSLVCAAR